MASSKFYVACSVALLLLSGGVVQGAHHEHEDEWKSEANAHSSGTAIANVYGTESHSRTSTLSKGADIKNRAHGSATARSTQPLYEPKWVPKGKWGGWKEELVKFADETSLSKSTAESKSDIDEEGGIDNKAGTTMKAEVVGYLDAKATGNADAKAFAKIWKKKDDHKDDPKIWKKKKPAKKWTKKEKKWTKKG